MSSQTGVWLAAALSLAGCPGRSSNGAPPMPERDVSDAEIDRQLLAAQDSRGDRPNLVAREQSLRWLVAHADRAWPRVLAAAQAAPTPRLVEILGRFDRPEATPLLIAALEAGGDAARVAGGALGSSHDPAGHDALFRALASLQPQVVMAGLHGLRMRGDNGACSKMLPLLSHADSEVRWMAVHAGAGLGCLDAAALDAIAAGDAADDVRRLAAEQAAALRQRTN
jgi:HEAT repeat protein